MQPGARLGPFVVDDILGRGAVGEVWAAHHAVWQTPVAVKVLAAEAFTGPEAIDGFLHEARLVASLRHPHIVEVHDIGRLGGDPYLVMERAEGTLREVVPLTWSRALPLARRLLSALAHAHGRGIVHRDVKPANVLLGGQEHGLRPADPLSGARLADFGLAIDGGTSATSGTPMFMAPEQATGSAPMGPWTDLYALGATLWTALTGSPPFTHPDPIVVIAQHLSAPLPPLAARHPLPDGLVEWLAWLLAKEPTDRPQSAAEALAGLHAVDAGAGPVRGAVPRLPSTVPPPLPPGRLPLLGVGLGVLGVQAPPLVGRRDVCASLFGRLVAQHADPAPRRLHLHGPAGVGRGRLARWLADLAHRHLGARVVDATEGLDVALATTELEPLGLEPWVADGLRRWFDGGGDTPPPLLRELLAAWGDRPVVVLARNPDGVTSASLDGLVTGRAGWLWVISTGETASSDDATEDVAVAPLPDSEMRVLLRETLALSTGLADRLTAQAGGLPGVGLAMAQALAASGALEVTPTGFTMASDTVLPVPRDLAQAWLQRVASCDLEPADLERLAVAGRALPRAEVVTPAVERWPSVWSSPPETASTSPTPPCGRRWWPVPSRAVAFQGTTASSPSVPPMRCRVGSTCSTPDSLPMPTTPWSRRTRSGPGGVGGSRQSARRRSHARRSPTIPGAPRCVPCSATWPRPA